MDIITQLYSAAIILAALPFAIGALALIAVRS